VIRTAEDEARSAKYAHVERERRWLIDPAQTAPLGGRFVLIEDRYISGTRMRLRRMLDSANGAVALKLTKKYDASDPLARPIVTTYLTEAEYALIATLPAEQLVKRRVALHDADHTYSIDWFFGPLEGLVLAEIEWPDDAGLRCLPPPPGAVREVSGDWRYEGGSLAVRGIPEEQ
jgi:CYTH domain-containing protein